MKKSMLFMAVALVVAAGSAFTPKVSVTGWYRESGVDFSGPTDQATCNLTLPTNCTITTETETIQTVYDAQANINDAAHVLKFQN